jgi:hypothetical protein
MEGHERDASIDAAGGMAGSRAPRPAGGGSLPPKPPPPPRRAGTLQLNSYVSEPPSALAMMKTYAQELLQKESADKLQREASICGDIPAAGAGPALNGSAGGLSDIELPALKLDKGPLDRPPHFQLGATIGTPRAAATPVEAPTPHRSRAGLRSSIGAWRRCVLQARTPAPSALASLSCTRRGGMAGIRRRGGACTGELPTSTCRPPPPPPTPHRLGHLQRQPQRSQRGGAGAPRCRRPHHARRHSAGGHGGKRQPGPPRASAPTAAAHQVAGARRRPVLGVRHRQARRCRRLPHEGAAAPQRVGPRPGERLGGWGWGGGGLLVCMLCSSPPPLYARRPPRSLWAPPVNSPVAPATSLPPTSPSLAPHPKPPTTSPHGCWQGDDMESLDYEGQYKPWYRKKKFWLITGPLLITLAFILAVGWELGVGGGVGERLAMRMCGNWECECVGVGVGEGCVGGGRRLCCDGLAGARLGRRQQEQGWCACSAGQPACCRPTPPPGRAVPCVWQRRARGPVPALAHLLLHRGSAPHLVGGPSVHGRCGVGRGAHHVHLAECALLLLRRAGGRQRGGRSWGGGRPPTVAHRSGQRRDSLLPASAAQRCGRCSRRALVVGATP